jgi:hypothetical protein
MSYRIADADHRPARGRWSVPLLVFVLTMLALVVSVAGGPFSAFAMAWEFIRPIFDIGLYK